MNTLLVLPWDSERGGVVCVAQNLATYLQTRGNNVFFLHLGKSVLMKTGRNKLGFVAATLRLVFPLAQPRPLVSAVSFPFLFPLVLVQLLWFLRKYRIQIVNLHYLNDRLWCFALCKRLLSIRLVSSIHGTDAFYRGEPKETYSPAFRSLIRHSDLVVLPSQAYRNKFVARFRKAEEKTIFIHNGINPDQFRPGNGASPTSAQRYILSIAELQPYKAIDVLLRAAKLLFLTDSSLKLVLAGDGPLRAELEELAHSLGIRNQTQFLGTQRAREIIDLLHGCELLVLASREEPFGIALIEAMACRKPVVATRVGGVPEIIEHEVSGILVESENPDALAEGLSRVLMNADLKRNLAENAYSRAMERFCLSHNGERYERAFASLLQFSSQQLFVRHREH